ncbi:MAG: inositol monophosphatase family protein, partial [Thiothrix sp.]|nr:inositol monophosphatase family protein [Thiothrix sp.]
MLPDIARLDRQIRIIAREEILSRYQHVDFSIKQDGSLLTEADLATNRRLQQFLHQQWPDIAFLSEEMEVSQQERRLCEADWLWILDPLDGTSNFAAGVPLFATSLALISKGEVVMGLSYDPIRDEMFSAIKDTGAWLNGRRLHCRDSGFPLENAVAFIDFKRLPLNLRQRLSHAPPYGSQRNIGSSVLEWAWMAA